VRLAAIRAVVYCKKKKKKKKIFLLSIFAYFSIKNGNQDEFEKGYCWSFKVPL